MSLLNAAICKLHIMSWMILFKKQLFDLEVKGQGPWHTALWSCTHIPNIVDQSGKTKKLCTGQENTI